MKIWNKCKDVMLTMTITALYANWSTKQLHECSTFMMWFILVAVAIITYLLIREANKQFRKLDNERRKKRNEKITGSAK